MVYEQQIYSAALAVGFPSSIAPYVVAQSKHETGNYGSNVFKTLNNAFGMKQPNVRKTTSLGESSIVMRSEGLTGYCTYANVKSSVQDLKYWFDYTKVDFSKIKTSDDYAAFLKSKGFYGATYALYSTALKKHLDNVLSMDLKSNTINVVTLFVFASLGLIGYKFLS